MLTQLANDLWIVSIPHKFLGLNFGARMTILRQQDQGLVVYSPVALNDDLKRQITSLGTVKHIIAPNLFHHLYVGEYGKAYPEAQVHGAAGLAKKRQDLTFHTELADGSPKAWANDLEQEVIEGMPKLSETVFFQESSRTLICCDLIQNFKNSQGLWTKFYLSVNRIHNRPGVSKVIKMIIGDKVKARESLERILSWDFDRIVMSHGEVIDWNGKNILKECYAWLLK
jgi:hypothetical protein